MRNYRLTLLACLLISLFLMGCVETMTDTQKGAAVGAAAGAVGGHIIGRNHQSTLIGAGVGALGGALINDAISQEKNKQGN
jgi:osmotically inducible lipoprotein OsmB